MTKQRAPLNNHKTPCGGRHCAQCTPPTTNPTLAVRIILNNNYGHEYAKRTGK
jgi:hypothetical protein